MYPSEQPPVNVAHEGWQHKELLTGYKLLLAGFGRYPLLFYKVYIDNYHQRVIKIIKNFKITDRNQMMHKFIYNNFI